MFLVHSRWNWNLEVLVLYERGKLDSPGENPLGARERTKNKLSPHTAFTPGFEPGPERLL